MSVPTTSDVRRFVEALGEAGEHELATFDEGTLELPWGWRVVLAPRRWLETRDPRFMLIGLGPTYVTRTGRVFTTGSGRPPEFYEEGIAWELAARHTLWGRLRMWWKGWSAEEYLAEQPRSHILARLAPGSWARELYERWTDDVSAASSAGSGEERPVGR